MDIKYDTPDSAITVISIANLANNAKGISSAIDNTSDLDVYADFILSVNYPATALSPGNNAAVAELYLVPSIDGVHFAEGSSVIDPQRSLMIGVFRSPNTAASSENLVMQEVKILPGYFFFILKNISGNPFHASTLTTLSMRKYGMQTG